MRFPGGQAGIALDQAALHLQWRNAHGVHDALRNSIMLPSPVRLTMRPWWSVMVGSIRSLRSALRRASVRSSSTPASRL